MVSEGREEGKAHTGDTVEGLYLGFYVGFGEGLVGIVLHLPGGIHAGGGPRRTVLQRSELPTTALSRTQEPSRAGSRHASPQNEPPSPVSPMFVSLLSRLLWYVRPRPSAPRSSSPPSAWFAFALPCYSTYKALAHSASADALQALSMYWALIGAFTAFEQTLGLFCSWSVPLSSTPCMS